MDASSFGNQKKLGKLKYNVLKINLKVIQKDKIRQTKLLGYVFIAIYVKNMYITKSIPPYIKFTYELIIVLPNNGPKYRGKWLIHGTKHD